MPSRIAEFVPLFMVLSSLASVLSLTVAFAAFRRTSRFEDVDYRPHITVTCSEPHGAVEVSREEYDAEDLALQRSLEAVFEGKVTNAGTRPVHLINGRVLLGPKHRDDPEHALTVPFHKTLGAGGECNFQFSLQWGTIWDVAEQFQRTSIDCHLAINVQGADGVTREIRRYLGTAMQCEGSEWILIEPHYFLEVLNSLQQAQLRLRLGPSAKSSIDVDPSIPF